MTDTENYIRKAAELRATTKWIIAGAVALASALIALFPTLYPTDKVLSAGRVVFLAASALITVTGIALVIFAASRVLGPRPTTIRDLLQLLDDRPGRRSTQHLMADLNRSRNELLPSEIETVRRLWDSRSRHTIGEAEFLITSERVLKYCDDRMTSRYFSSLLRYLATFGLLAGAGTLALTAGLASAPRAADLEWLSTSREVDVLVPDDRIPRSCDSNGVLHGFLLAFDRHDSRYLFAASPTPTCSAFSVILDAVEAPPVPVPLAMP